MNPVSTVKDVIAVILTALLIFGLAYVLVKYRGAIKTAADHVKVEAALRDRIGELERARSDCEAVRDLQSSSIKLAQDAARDAQKKSDELLARVEKATAPQLKKADEIAEIIKSAEPKEQSCSVELRNIFRSP